MCLHKSKANKSMNVLRRVSRVWRVRLPSPGIGVWTLTLTSLFNTSLDASLAGKIFFTFLGSVSTSHCFAFFVVFFFPPSMLAFG